MQYNLILNVSEVFRENNDSDFSFGHDRQISTAGWKDPHIQKVSIEYPLNKNQKARFHFSLCSSVFLS